MELEFNLQAVETVVFGVGRSVDQGTEFCEVSADSDVQGSLQEMVEQTKKEADKTLESGYEPERYNPAEAYGTKEYVYLPLKDDLTEHLRNLHNANLTTDNDALSDPSTIFCYFAKMVDGDGNHLTALRRPTQFKSVLKKHLIALINDAVRQVEEDMFQLDYDFDLIVDEHNVHILRPLGFAALGGVQSAILEAVPENIASIREHMDFVDFSNIEEYATNHPRAASYLASIRSQGQMENIDPALLQELCNVTSVELSIREEDEKITVEERFILGFLEVLDRRRYPIELRRGARESYKAYGRRKTS